MKVLLACCCMVCLPLKYLRVTSAYGYRIHPLTGKYTFHAGVDLRARHDTVFAVMSGTIRSVSWSSCIGINIRLDQDSIEAVYGHLSRVLVSAGDYVDAGDPVAITGATGLVTGEHLHFSIRIGHSYTDPLEFIYQNLLNNENHE